MNCMTRTSIRRNRTGRGWVRATAMILLAVFTSSACYSWRPTMRPVPQVIEENPRAVLRITRDDGRSTKLHSVRVTGDSLSARTEALSRWWCLTFYGCPLTFIIRRSVEMPLGDVRSTEVRHTNRGRTAIAVASVTALVGFVVWFGSECGWICGKEELDLGPRQ